MPRWGSAIAVMAVVMIAASIWGCRRTTPLRFEPDMMSVIELELVPEHRQQIAKVVDDLFGTPDQPKVPDGVDLDLAKLEMAAGAAGYVEADEAGLHRPRGLYRQHCAQCHGIAGDARGPAAAVVNARPRDFRLGVFKFKSTWHAAKPTDDDLRRTVARGLAGTAMPSFILLDGEALGRDAKENSSRIDALVEYVKYLSLRGEVERELMVTVADEFDFDPRAQTTDDPFDPETDSGDRDLVDQIVAEVASAWQEAPNQRVEIDPATIPSKDRTAEELASSISAGDKLFHSEIAKCNQCHGATGRGDGELSLTGLQEYDDWNQRELDFRRATEALAANLKADGRRGEVDEWAMSQLKARQRLVGTFLPAEKVRPRDLADGVFRGGGEPKDLFLRIHQGIPGTPMPAHGSPRPGVAGALTDDQIWQLVDYIRSLRGDTGRVAQQAQSPEPHHGAN